MSQLRKYHHDPTSIVQIQPDEISLKQNLTFETVPVCIEDRKIKKLKGKEIPLVKVIWGQGEITEATWELENQMREDYPNLFQSV